MIRIHYMKKFNKYIKREREREVDRHGCRSNETMAKVLGSNCLENINELKNIQGRPRGWLQNHVVYSVIKRTTGVHQEN